MGISHYKRRKNVVRKLSFSFIYHLSVIVRHKNMARLLDVNVSNVLKKSYVSELIVLKA